MTINSVITLEDDINCLLLDKAELDNVNYFLSVVLDDNNEPTEEYAILKEINENDELFVEKEEDETIVGELLKTFTRNFNTLVSELPEEID
ncbi:MAG: hypothetical protein E7172_03605 [Firmicutes bacterium]|nr:hypothetical protein [Bacillota bacterium]